MTDRRRELLEPLLKELNPKAYEATCQEIGAELSDIYQTLFEIKYDEIKDNSKTPKKNELDAMNSIGFKSIEYSRLIIE